MKRFVCFVLLLLCIPMAAAIPYEQAVEIGEQFIRENAEIGHKGFFMPEYDISLSAVYQNELNYRIFYAVSTELLGIKKQRYILVEMSKEGEIKRIYASKLSGEKLLM